MTHIIIAVNIGILLAVVGVCASETRHINENIRNLTANIQLNRWADMKNEYDELQNVSL